MSSDSDRQQPELLQRLQEDHVRLAKVLDIIEAELGKYDQDEEVDLDLLRSAVDYIERFPDAVHHPLEDVVFEQLTRAELTPDQQSALERNVREHRDLAAATKKVAADIDLLFADTVVPLNRLRKDISAYLTMQREHMSREQAEIFPLAERHITNEAWLALLDETGLHKDPLFSQKEARFESLHAYVTETDRG